MQGGKSRDGQLKCPAKPLAIFRWDEESNKLVPVAIQLDASKDAVTYTPKDSRIYTPKEAEPNDWLFAKICVQVCFLWTPAVFCPAVCAADTARKPLISWFHKTCIDVQRPVPFIAML